jgi:hypothetical protein
VSNASYSLKIAAPTGLSAADVTTILTGAGWNIFSIVPDPTSNTFSVSAAWTGQPQTILLPEPIGILTLQAGILHS